MSPNRAKYLLFLSIAGWLLFTQSGCEREEDYPKNSPKEVPKGDVNNTPAVAQEPKVTLTQLEFDMLKLQVEVLRRQLKDTEKQLAKKEKERLDALASLPVDALAKRREDEKDADKRYEFIGLLLNRIEKGTARQRVQELLGKPSRLNQAQDCDLYDRFEWNPHGWCSLEVRYKEDKYEGYTENKHIILGPIFNLGW